LLKIIIKNSYNKNSTIVIIEILISVF